MTDEAKPDPLYSADEVEAAVNINREDLRGEMLSLPKLLYTWETRVTVAMNEAEKHKVELEQAAASVRHGLLHDHAGMPESVIEAAMTSHPQLTTMRRRVAEYAKIQTELVDVLEGVRAKKEMLVALAAAGLALPTPAVAFTGGARGTF